MRYRHLLSRRTHLHRCRYPLAALTLVLVLPGCAAVRSEAVEDAAADIDSLTIHSTVYTDSPVTLRHGEFRKPAAPGAASEIVVRVTDRRIFKDGTGAVVLTTSTGGTGTFFELALLVKEDTGKWGNPDTKLLGDRIRVHSLAFEGDDIVVDMSTQADKDPMCCPTRRVLKRFAVHDGRLNVVSEIPALVGSVWQWVQTLYNNDERAVPAEREDYTVELMENGQVKVKADCNATVGNYSLKGHQLAVDIDPSSAVACAPRSLATRFIRDLNAAANFFFVKDHLYIDLKYDTGTMKFSR